MYLNASFTMAQQDATKFLWLNPELSFEQRANDLVSQMTLDEKISQMMNDAPAIDRLGVPQYDWWGEALHGVARAGLATVFPQAIGLGAMWDQELMFRLSTVISDEARAKHHEFIRRGKRNRYQGLTMWSPNINIFRDPRWGRGQETYGEDPYLTGKMAVQFIKGLQGDDPKYFKTIATVKHYAVHNGPEPERHTFDALTDERDFRETYLPQFEMGIKDGKAYSAMCAYNRYNGEACCGSDHLMNRILRQEWNFNGYIVSDCGAINDIYLNHKLVKTSEEAAALGVISGCDLNCGRTYESLKKAVEKGLLSEADIDVAVQRLFTARFKLGMFDPDDLVTYAKIPYETLDCQANRELALKAARESIVLLKNNDGLLPLDKSKINTIAVIGPNSDQWLMLLGNYNGVPSDPVTPLRGISEAVSPNIKVLYEQGCELAEGMPVYHVIPSEFLLTDTGQQGLKAEFFANKEYKGKPLYTSTVKNIDANWYDAAPRADMDDDNFSVHWTGKLKPDHNGTYQLGIISTCNTQIYLDGKQIATTRYHFFNEFADPRLVASDKIELKAGKEYDIKVDASESYADAQVQLVWYEPIDLLKQKAIDAAQKADVVVMCMGLTSRLEGEEMRIKIEGFRGGDRTRLDLPEVQEDLIKSIHTLGKPIVLVLLNGSALAVNWENENIPAIIEAWYPGQASGTAIADVIFGKYNPGGRLPVTFYKSVDDLPPFEEYHMINQTYRYFKGEPLYPFGYGLSYTTFQYDNLVANKTCKAGDQVTVSVDVKNTGKLAGDEVVQLYLANKSATVPVPIRSLKGFTRINLQPGETQTVSFVLQPNDFSVINEAFKREIQPGEFEISVGGRQPGPKLDSRQSNVLQALVQVQ
ncbi:glycoside hydrolase family 3 C-terminal domain-containing protein [candidate division KSB1 bacterium]|nr:glycoside hydrolase family 3 C-terminal domain-containing protein [candidate division KSB1 bacterium]